jgi:hypothetical protein
MKSILTLKNESMVSIDGILSDIVYKNTVSWFYAAMYNLLFEVKKCF